MAMQALKILQRLKKLEARLDRLASDFFVTSSFTGAAYAGLWRPPVDVYETEGEVVVRVEAPGLREEDISLALYGDTLVVRGVRRDPRCDTRCCYHRLEIHHGHFERIIALPGYICHEEAEASYSEGFLVIRFPKRCEAAQRAVGAHLRM